MYILLKDIPGVDAGTKFVYNSHFEGYVPENEPYGQLVFRGSIITENSWWFVKEGEQPAPERFSIYHMSDDYGPWYRFKINKPIPKEKWKEIANLIERELNK